MSGKPPTPHPRPEEDVTGRDDVHAPTCFENHG
jgi:hypothetical protein